MAQRLLLARHGRVVEAHARGFLGRTDAPLGADGRAQAGALAARVRALAPDLCVASPLRRAVETAALAAPGLEPQIDPDLREIDFGEWEGRTFPEIRASHPAKVDRWAAWEADFAFPGGESLADFLTRVRRAAERLAAEPHGTVLAVTHGGVIRALVCRLLGLPPRSYVAFDVRLASLTTIKLFDGKGVLSGLENPAEEG